MLFSENYSVFDLAIFAK